MTKKSHQNIFPENLKFVLHEIKYFCDRIHDPRFRTRLTPLARVIGHGGQLVDCCVILTDILVSSKAATKIY